MEPATILLLSSAAMAAPVNAYAQVAGSTVVGVAAVGLREVATGWSAKRQALGRAVYNDQAKPERIGKIDDIIVAPDKAVPYVIINAGSFVGAFEHDTATPRLTTEGSRRQARPARRHEGGDEGEPRFPIRVLKMAAI
ncbi:MAG TPA: hypothetical protein VMI72_05775 [Roseiarcus sp.]|nr:hypothetical protein [Roseiarcus sp.]